MNKLFARIAAREHSVNRVFGTGGFIIGVHSSSLCCKGVKTSGTELHDPLEINSSPHSPV